MNRSDLKGKTIVAYEKGYLNWLKPEYDSQDRRLLRHVAGRSSRAWAASLPRRKIFPKHDLAKADVLLLIHPDEPWSDATLERVWEYVRRGGSLLLVADPVISRGGLAKQFQRRVAAHGHAGPLRHGRHADRQLGAILRGARPSGHRRAGRSAEPVRLRVGLVDPHPLAGPAGRWWDAGDGAIRAATPSTTGVSYYNAGKLLGDLVLAAEQPLGSGRVFVLGDTSPLRNEMLANAYPFVGRLLGYLANRPSSPQAFWRQLLGLAALLALAALVALRPAAWQVMLTVDRPVVVVGLLHGGRHIGRAASCPTAACHTSRGFNNVAYIDASHLEAYSSDLWTRPRHRRPAADADAAGVSAACWRRS